MSIWNYVVTAHKPTNVTHSCVGNFTSPQDLNLIIAYSSIPFLFLLGFFLLLLFTSFFHQEMHAHRDSPALSSGLTGSFALPFIRYLFQSFYFNMRCFVFLFSSFLDAYVTESINVKPKPKPIFAAYTGRADIWKNCYA